MKEKEKWVTYDDPNKHFFKKNNETSEWDKYEGEDNIVDTYTLRTYIPNGLIIYEEKSGKFVELSDGLAKLTNQNIEKLDEPNDEYNSIKGFWVEKRN